MNDDTIIHLTLNNVEESEQFGADLAMSLAVGGAIHFKGDLGSGKSTIARALIRTLCCDPRLEVPSPTFALVQNYLPPADCPIGEILHGDLYRISDPRELDELGLTDNDTSVLCLVEWPENGGNQLPDPNLLISLSDVDGGTGRNLKITGDAKWLQQLGRSLAIRKFLDTGWGKSVTRSRLTGDASSRAYEAVFLNGENRILMNAPRKPDGPAIRDGKPYSQIAYLAEDVSAFAGTADILRRAGLRTPAIYHQSLEDGLLLLENLGTGQIIDAEQNPIEARYIAASEMLAGFHHQDHPREAQLAVGKHHHVPDYDQDAMRIETELLLDWYAPRFKGSPLSLREKQEFAEIWNALFDRLKASEKRIVLRDFHSPNIIWREAEAGTQRVAVIDFQDAVYGPSAYDLASLAQDARVDISPYLESRLVERYIEKRADTDDFDSEIFRSDYAIMAAQRATKILGIFVRLDERDKKPGYLKHLPRIQSYLVKNLECDVLADYREWCKSVIGL